MNSLATIPAPSALAPRPSEIYASGCTLDEMHAAHKARQWRMNGPKGESAHDPKNPKPSVFMSGSTRVLHEIAKAHGVTVADILGTNRETKFNRARQEAMFRMRVELHRSYPQIARFLGGKDHTTIIHGIKKHAQRSGFPVPDRFVGK